MNTKIKSDDDLHLMKANMPKQINVLSSMKVLLVEFGLDRVLSLLHEYTFVPRLHACLVS